MNLFDTINQDIKVAMKAREKDRLETLRSIKSALMLLRTEEKGKIPGSAEEIKVLQRLVKQRNESAAIYKEQNRQELADKEIFEAGIIEQYLPAQLGKEELEEEIRAVIEETGAGGMSDMGRVMGQLTKKLAGKADGKMMAEMVKQLLS
jgi:uncharacterized protein YqeY